MKLFKLTSILAILTLFLSVSIFADTEKKEAPKELKNQTHCPVMGGEIDSTVYTDIQGQRVYHCCAMCSNSLKKDPDKFFGKAATDGILFENIQETCPISGEKLGESSVFTDFEGRRVNFCSDKCQTAFNEDPAKVLAKMDKPAKDKKEKKHDHSGHNH